MTADNVVVAADAGGVIVAVDAGGSKTDAVALGLDGSVIAFRRGTGGSPHQEGLQGAVAVVDALIGQVAGTSPVAHASLFVSGLDLPIEIDEYRTAIADFAWASPSTEVANDLFALLRAGTDEPNAIAVICGTGINAVGVRADGADVRFPALGEISGDWGGGSGIGIAALWHAARDVDGRGPHTELTAAIVAALGVASVGSLIEDLHFGRRATADLAMLTPTVLDAAEAGDAVARAIVERQAEEIAAFVKACVTRLDLADVALPVVLGGGVIGSHQPMLRATRGGTHRRGRSPGEPAGV